MCVCVCGGGRVIPYISYEYYLGTLAQHTQIISFNPVLVGRWILYDISYEVLRSLTVLEIEGGGGVSYF
jgi:hypothetical protein